MGSAFICLFRWLIQFRKVWNKSLSMRSCLILLVTLVAEAADEIICAVLNSLYFWKLCEYTPITTILTICSFLSLLLSFPLCTSPFFPRSYSLPTPILPLCVYTLFSFHLLCLLGDLLTVQVDATVWNHGAGVSGRKVSIHVCLHLQESIRRGCEVDRQLILKFVSSLSMA